MILDKLRSRRDALLDKLRGFAGDADCDEESDYLEWLDTVVSQGVGCFSAARKLRESFNEHSMVMDNVESFISACQEVAGEERKAMEAAHRAR